MLTTESQGVIDTAVVAVIAAINERFGTIGLTDWQLQAAAGAVVRLVLSYIMRPGASRADAVAQISWIAGRIVR